MTPPIIVAEIAAAHNGSLDRAKELILAAKYAGADMVKFQLWDQMALPGHVIADGPWKGRDLAGLYEECRTPREWFPELFRLARSCGLTPFATPFDRGSVDFLETLDCPMYKIASAEIVDLPLIGYVASKGKPVVISTGMATFPEICAAVDAANGVPVTLLKCVSAYPARVEDANLMTMVELRYGVSRHRSLPVGLSDHTQGSSVAMAATALGASMIEKHIGLDRSGPDGGFCTLPGEFAEMVRGVHEVAAAMGEVRYGPLPSEASTLALRRSLWIVRDVKAGELVSEESVRSLRPAGGMLPGTPVTGWVFTRDVKAGSALVKGMVV